MNKQQKIFIGCLSAFIIISTLILLSAYFIHHTLIEAFGSKVSVITIPITDSSNLVCKQTYSADFADVFYDVDFSLIENKYDSIYLGNATFSTDKWHDFYKILFIQNWIVLQISEPGSYAAILVYNRDNSARKDTIFTPHELKNDSLWRNLQMEQPAYMHPGSSILDSTYNNKFYIIYQYREGDNEPFVFYNQKIEYEMDTLTGKIKTIKILDRIKK